MISHIVNSKITDIIYPSKREMEMMPTETQMNEILRMKSYRPFMICYGAFNPTTGEWFVSASPTKHRINKLAREGWQVWTV
jgi:hypothetical protein